MSDYRQRPKLRAPVENRSGLIYPPLGEASTHCQQNRSVLDQWDFDFGGHSAQQLRTEARGHLLTQAKRFTAAYRDVRLTADLAVDSPFVLTGHQPELFHAGVWFKNFVLDRLGRECHAVPIHLIIDNDVPGIAAIRVPTGTVSEPSAPTIPIDRHVGIPYEEAKIQDWSLYRSFDERVHAAVNNLVPNPLVLPGWQEAIKADETEKVLGYRLARFRHRQEAEMGLQTLELPLSAACDHWTFHALVANLLARHEQVHRIYNESVVEHRQVHRIRSGAHPVPNLIRRDEWYELPFWIWTEADPRRRQLFARRSQTEIEITDHGSGGSWMLGSDESTIAEGLSEVRRAGVKVRPRALMTTLFARLMLSDLFLHGIGGANYDELTDVLILGLFQVKPPLFFTATSTLRLPIAYPRVPPQRLSTLKQQLHQMRFHPERFLSAAAQADGQVSTWLAQKKRWIAKELPRGQRKQRHAAIAEANQALRTVLQSQVSDVQTELQRAMIDVRRQLILDSREYSFCLFPHSCIQDALFDCLLSCA